MNREVTMTTPATTKQVGTDTGRALLRIYWGTGDDERLRNAISDIEAEAAQVATYSAWQRLKEMGPRPIRLSVIQAVLLGGQPADCPDLDGCLERMRHEPGGGHRHDYPNQ